MLNIQPIPAFHDNYIWLITVENNNQAYVVDPGDATPVLTYLKEKQLELAGILITHHHFDHTGGIKKLNQEFNVPVYGPAHEKIPNISSPLSEDDFVSIFNYSFKILEIPGHTSGHIAYYCQSHQPPLLFCGDTLFAGGCGRLFEGTPAQMHESLNKIKNLADDTAVYCAHEYTLANLQFAQTVEPNNTKLLERIQFCKSQRENNQPTIPSRLMDEKETNPFLRCEQDSIKQAAESYLNSELLTSIEVFKTVRQWKDDF